MEIKQVSVALLTGGSSGIGAATARLLAESGITVYAGSRRGTVEKPPPGSSRSSWMSTTRPP